MQKKLAELTLDRNDVISLLVGDLLASRQTADALIFSGEFLHKRKGGVVKRQHTPVRDIRDAWRIPTVNA